VPPEKENFLNGLEKNPPRLCRLVVRGGRKSTLSSFKPQEIPAGGEEVTSKEGRRLGRYDAGRRSCSTQKSRDRPKFFHSLSFSALQ